VFPIFYLPLLDGDMAVAALLTTRNALLVVLLGWSVRQLVRLAPAPRDGRVIAERRDPHLIARSATRPDLGRDRSIRGD
jgi:hypothetical protein